VHIVAHSYGGLVTRAAMLAGANNVGRVIMLGTPNHGTYTTLQGIRGSHWVLRILSALDPHHDAADLGRIFGSFPSIYDQLPARGRVDGADIYDPAAWPKQGLQPRVELLERAPAMHERIDAVKGDFVVIAGHGYPTVTRATVENDQFRYEGTTAGDGWVTVDGAAIDGLPTYFVEAAHLGLVSDPRVMAAVLDLLAGRTTDKLSTTPPIGKPIPVTTDAEPGPTPLGGRPSDQLEPSDVANAFAQIFNVPVSTVA